MEYQEEENKNPSGEENASLVFTLDFSSQNLKSVTDSISKYRLCKSLNLSCNSITSIKADDFSSCLQLKELKLYGNKLESINGLSKLAKLEELHLQFNDISSIGNSLKNNRSLKVLRLDSNKLCTIKSKELSMLCNLTSLDISSNCLTDIECLIVLTSLERLYCTHNHLKKIPNLFPLKKLKEIDFSNNLLTDVSGLKGCHRLQIISLNYNNLTDLLSIGKLKLLQVLRVCNNVISDLKHILEQFNTLEVLEISKNQIASLAQIKCLLNLSSVLKELSIYGNPVMMDNDQKSTVSNIIQNIQLDVLENNYLHKEKFVGSGPRTLMRPMSAHTEVSDRFVQDQINLLETSLVEFTDQMKHQFHALKDSISASFESKESSILSRITTTSPVYNILDHSKCNGRPISRCSSRARLKEAQEFAEKHF